MGLYCNRILLKKCLNYKLLYRSSYVVLVPEIGEESSIDQNANVQSNNLPEFDKLTVENCIASISKQSGEFERGIRIIEDSIKNTNSAIEPFKHIIDPIELLGTSLDTIWGISKTLYLGHQTLMPTKSYISIHDRARRARSSKFNSQPIFNVLKDFATTESTNENNRIINKYVLEGKLNGLNLDEDKKIPFIEYSKKLNIERQHFKSKLDQATKVFSDVIYDYSIVKDFPPELIRAIAKDSSRPMEGPWKITLNPYVYKTFMEYCPVRELRWNIWQAKVSRSSSLNEKSLDNSVHVEAIRTLRQHKAALLGYKNYVEMSMETKMAKNIEEVKNMLDSLLKFAKPAQTRELDSLSKFSKERGSTTNLKLWDIPYWKRKQLASLFDFDDHQIKEYFTLNKVKNGLFRLSEDLFGICIKRKTDNIITWAKDVEYYEIFDNETKKLLSGFYLDPYIRHQEKIRLTEDSGYVVAIRNRSSLTNTTPLASLIFNFNPPNVETNNESLLTFNDVQIFFQKFGHSLQHLLTEANYSEVAGLSNIEWDAVGICKNILTHWLYDSKVLKSISGHYETNESLPDEMIENIKLSKSHMAGFELSNQLYLSHLDLELHSNKEFWLNIIRNLWPTYFQINLDKRDAHVCSFSELFCDEWAAAYYSHVWSKLISADVYGAFYETKDNQDGVREVGKRFRKTFLALGGSCHPSEIFRRFRGRDPNPKALIHYLDLKNIDNVKNEQ